MLCTVTAGSQQMLEFLDLILPGISSLPYESGMSWGSSALTDAGI